MYRSYEEYMRNVLNYKPANLMNMPWLLGENNTNYIQQPSFGNVILTRPPRLSKTPINNQYNIF
jgi:hypothetical protein